VQDTTGGVVQSADVEVTNQDTGITSRAQSNQAGIFLFPALQPGRYEVRIIAGGFQSLVQSNVVLESARDLRGNYTLEIGALTESTVVEAQTMMISTASSEQRAGLEHRQLEELPVLNRNISGLLTLSPGVQTGGLGGNRSVRLSGMGGQSTAYAVDGVEASGQADGRQLSSYGGNNRVDLLGAEAVEEVQIVKGVIPAEYQHTISGLVNIITKSGTSQVHGSVFEMYQGSGLASIDPFLKEQGIAKAPVKYNQYGGSVGFPVIQRAGGPLSNAFGYFTYEGYQEERGKTVTLNSTPTQLARDVLRSSPNFNARERQAIAAGLERLPLPTSNIDNRTCAACGGAVGLTGRYVAVANDLRSDDTFMFKSDLHMRDGSVFLVSYNKLDPTATIATVTQNNTNFQDQQRRFGVNWFKAHGAWSYDVRWGRTFIEQSRPNDMVTVLDPLAPESNVPYDTLLANWGVSGLFTTPGGEIRAVWSPTQNITAKMGYLKGTHSLKWGGNYRQQGGGFSNPQSAEHRYDTFERFYDNQGATTMRVSLSQPFHDFPTKMFGFFVQDDWKVRNNLTLNAGLRYDYIGMPTLANSTSSKYPTAPDQNLRLANFAEPTVFSTFNFGDDLADPLKDDGNNFAPRIGFAWNVKGDATTVVRGGFAQMFTFVPLNPLRDMIMDGVNPRFLTMVTADIQRFGLDSATTTSDARRAVATLIAESGTRTAPAVLVDQNLKAPYTQHVTLGFQHSVTSDSMLEVDFVVNRGIGLPLQRWLNQPDRITGVRPNPDLLANHYLDSSQESDYKGLQTAFRKRIGAGILAVSYTLGKTLATSGGDVGHFLAASDNTLCCQDFFDPAVEIARPSNDIRHYFNANWVYDIPSPQGFSRHILGGLTFAGIMRMNSGGPLAISQPAGGRGVQRPDLLVHDLDDVRAAGNYRETRLYLDRSAFLQIPTSNGQPIRAGNTPRTIVEGPGYWNTDLSLARNFRIRQSVSLQIRWDALNALNRVNYNNPITAVNNSQFGEITGAGQMRQQQLSVKFTF
jgi:hypothetical protein